MSSMPAGPCRQRLSHLWCRKAPRRCLGAVLCPMPAWWYIKTESQSRSAMGAQFSAGSRFCIGSGTFVGESTTGHRVLTARLRHRRHQRAAEDTVSARPPSSQPPAPGQRASDTSTPARRAERVVRWIPTSSASSSKRPWAVAAACLLFIGRREAELWPSLVDIEQAESGAGRALRPCGRTVGFAGSTSRRLP